MTNILQSDEQPAHLVHADLDELGHVGRGSWGDLQSQALSGDLDRTDKQLA